MIIHQNADRKDKGILTFTENTSALFDTLKAKLALSLFERMPR